MHQIRERAPRVAGLQHDVDVHVAPAGLCNVPGEGVVVADAAANAPVRCIDKRDDRGAWGISGTLL
jgi:hypothetical protein